MSVLHVKYVWLCITLQQLQCISMCKAATVSVLQNLFRCTPEPTFIPLHILSRAADVSACNKSINLFQEPSQILWKFSLDFVFILLVQFHLTPFSTVLFLHSLYGTAACFSNYNCNLDNMFDSFYIILCNQIRGFFFFLVKKWLIFHSLHSFSMKFFNYSHGQFM